MANPSSKRQVDGSGTRKVQRIQLDLSPIYVERLNELKDDMQATSYAEVVREAIRLLTVLNRLDKKTGIDELLVKQSDGKEKSIVYLNR